MYAYQHSKPQRLFDNVDLLLLLYAILSNTLMYGGAYAMVSAKFHREHKLRAFAQLRLECGASTEHTQYMCAHGEQWRAHELDGRLQRTSAQKGREMKMARRYCMALCYAQNMRSRNL